MTCRPFYRCLQTYSRSHLFPCSSTWRSVATALEAPSLAINFYSTTRKQRKTSATQHDPELATFWTEIHKAESYLKLPLSKTDGRWRAKRLRWRARDLVQQVTQRKLQQLGSSREARAQILSEMSDLQRELYNEDPEDSTQTDRQAAPDTIEEEEEEISKAEEKMKSSLKNGDAEKEPARPRRSKKNMEPWQIQKEALETKFKGEAWAPRKRLSPDTMDGVRMLHQKDPEKYNTEVLAKSFEVSPEAIRRILRSKWQPSTEEAEDRRQRWERRGEKIWTNKVAMGMKPPKKWRELGVGKPEHGFYPQWKHGGERKPAHLVKPESVPWGSSYAEARDSTRSRKSVSSQIL